MCGRYVSVQSDADLTDEFDVEEVVGDPPAPSWNVAPTDAVRVVVERENHDTEQPQRQLRTVRWGLVPSWSKDRTTGLKMINARAETVSDKPAFARAAARRRCLVPALGYYEWQRTDDGKIPYFLHAPGEAPLAMAGLYEIWRDPALDEDDDAAWLWTCTVVTRPATDALGEIHDRCPVIVPPELQGGWLDCRDAEAATARALLDRMPEPHLEPRRVGRAVGNVRTNGPQLIEAPSDEDDGVPEQLATEL